MTKLEKLIGISSHACSEYIPKMGNFTDDRLYEILALKNGFFAFEQALEVFPCGISRLSYSLDSWNDEPLWRHSYGELAPLGVCFAQDIFGSQFVLSDVIYTFDPETGDTERFATDFEEWAENILNNYNIVTGHALAREWQSNHHRISPKSRLVPVTPFVLGGEFSVANLIEIDAAKAMRVRGSLAQQIQSAPDGARISYEVIE